VRLILNFFGLLRVVGRRFISHFGLLAAIIAGFIIAVAIVTSIPIYAEAVGYRILRTELNKGTNSESHPPFAFMYRYIGSQSGAIAWEDLGPINQYMEQRLVSRLGLPNQQMIRYASTDKLRFMTPDGFGEPIFWANFVFATDIENHISVIEGEYPKPAVEGGPVEVLLSEEKANELGFQVGEDYLILGPSANRDPKVNLPIRVSGIWVANDRDEDYWFYDPTAFEDSLIVPEASFISHVATAADKTVYTALWYAVMDGERVRSRDAAQLTANINRSLTEAAGLLPGTSLSLSPYNALIMHQRQVSFLTILLTVFSIPLLGVAAYFIILVTGMVVQQQQNEIAVLRSRGTSRIQVLWIYLLEASLLGIFAFVLGPPLGREAARLMTWTRSFLDFVPREGMPVELASNVWTSALQVVILAVFSSLIPALAATRYTIVSYKLERARSVRAPLWQRLFIDILLLVPVYYGYQQLSSRGTISFLGVNSPAGDPFQNPLLLLVPTLFVFAFALFSLRVFPLVMNALAWICSQFPGASILLAMRYLARTTRGYTGPIMLLIITMSLATFTSSMSLTLDQYLYDRAYYMSGTDLRMSDLGQDTQPATISFGAQPSQSQQNTTESGQRVNEARWLFVPVSDYLTIPGIIDATRVGRSEVQAFVNNKFDPGVFLGVDRADLPAVVGKAFRSDYAREPLGEIMNRLADDPGALLVSSNYLAANGLRVGDRVSLEMSSFGTAQRVPFVIVGDLKLFPTVYEDKPFFIGNLDYVFEMQGGQFPYEVWATTEPGTVPQEVIRETERRGLRVFYQEDADSLIEAELIRPERQGVFGLLSVGFLASAFLTVLGFLFYSVLSFRRRFVELGMLRAIGLSVGQMGMLLTCEQGLIIGIGMGIGTLLGVTASQLFIPFLQVRSDINPNTPPFVVEIAWDQIGIIYGIFGSMLVLAVIITMVLLARMRIFQAVKLGEAV
jgi:putative ABC transport system permease protein